MGPKSASGIPETMQWVSPYSTGIFPCETKLLRLPGENKKQGSTGSLATSQNHYVIMSVECFLLVRQRGLCKNKPLPVPLNNTY